MAPGIGVLTVLVEVLGSIPRTHREAHLTFNTRGDLTPFLASEESCVNVVYINLLRHMNTCVHMCAHRDLHINNKIITGYAHL